MPWLLQMCRPPFLCDIVLVCACMILLMLLLLLFVVVVDDDDAVVEVVVVVLVVVVVVVECYCFLLNIIDGDLERRSRHPLKK